MVEKQFPLLLSHTIKMIEAAILFVAWLIAIIGCVFSFSRVNQYITKYRLAETRKSLLYGKIHLRHVKTMYVVFLILIGIFICTYFIIILI